MKSDFLAYENANGELFDFHAQRGQMITALEQANVPLKTLQALARHSSVETTLRHYSRKPRLADSRAALDNLPPLPGTGPDRDLLRATGTEGAQPRLRNACAFGDLSSDGLTQLDTRAGGKTLKRTDRLALFRKDLGQIRRLCHSLRVKGPSRIRTGE
jgi:hypothetical protein